MEYRHVLAFAIHGLTSNSIENEISLIDDSALGVRSVLVKDVGDRLTIIEKGIAIERLMLSVFSGKRKEGTPVEIIQKEATNSLDRMRKKFEGSAVLVIEISGEIDIDSTAIHEDVGEFVVGFDFFDKRALSSQHLQVISSIVSSLPLSLSKIEPVEKLRDDIYLIDSNGKVYYSITPSLSLKVRISSQLTPEIVQSAQFYMNCLLDKPDMAKPIRLFHQSIEERSDTFMSFLYAWTGLEMFINKAFPYYESKFIESIKQGASSHALDHYLDRVSTVMRDQYSLLDKYTILSHFIAGELSEVDIEQFKNLKKIRNNLFHRGNIHESDLPIDDIQALLHNCISQHLIKYECNDVFTKEGTKAS